MRDARGLQSTQSWRQMLARRTVVTTLQYMQVLNSYIIPEINIKFYANYISIKNRITHKNM